MNFDHICLPGWQDSSYGNTVGQPHDYDMSPNVPRLELEQPQPQPRLQQQRAALQQSHSTSHLTFVLVPTSDRIRGMTRGPYPWRLRPIGDVSVANIGLNIKESTKRRLVAFSRRILLDRDHGKPFLDVLLTTIAAEQYLEIVRTGQDRCVVSCIGDEESGFSLITVSDLRRLMVFLVGGPRLTADTINETVQRITHQTSTTLPRGRALIRQDHCDLKARITGYTNPRAFEHGDSKVYKWNDLEACLERFLRSFRITSPTI